MDAEEGRDRHVEARHLHGDQAKEQYAAASAAIAFHPNAADVELLHRWQ